MREKQGLLVATMTTRLLSIISTATSPAEAMIGAVIGTENGGRRSTSA